ncbi:MAG: HSP20 family protein [Cyclobacteriaceae bacterium]|jgi:HSP20 family protein
MTLISKRKRGNIRGNKFLSGFGTDNYLEDFFTDRVTKRSIFMNASENEEKFQIELGIPNFNKDNLNLDLQDSQLVISGSHNETSIAGQGKYKKQQVNCSDFSHSLPLPKHAKSNGVEAKYEDGILKISVHKKEGHEHLCDSVQMK